MVDNDNNKRRRLAEFKDGCRYGKFGKTKAYELIACDSIKAYKLGGKTMIDLDSVDEFHAALPRIETKVNQVSELRNETERTPSQRLSKQPDQCRVKPMRSA